jgi:hypothetical protein
MQGERCGRVAVGGFAGTVWRGRAGVTFRQKVGPRVGRVPGRALKLRRGAVEGTARKGVMVFTPRAL